MKKASDLMKNYLNLSFFLNRNTNTKFLLLKSWNNIFGKFSSDIEFFDVKNRKTLIINVKNSSILYYINMNQENFIDSIKNNTGLDISEIKVFVK